MSTSDPTFTAKTVLITGAAGGLGRALVSAFAAAGSRVIAATRDGRFPDPDTQAVAIDVADRQSVAAAARGAGPIDVLVNNAGANANLRLFAPDAYEEAEREMAANYLGVLAMIRAFAPAMRERRQGAIVNILSGLSLVNLPLAASYCASKAAAWSLTQAARAELAPYGVRVHAVFAPAMDTRMTAQMSGPKMRPDEAAAAILAAIRAGEEDAYIGASRDLAARLRQDPKAVERTMAARLPASGR